jgi:hypothetical protein
MFIGDGQPPKKRFRFGGIAKGGYPARMPPRISGYRFTTQTPPPAAGDARGLP